jgi:hypothetical protein
MDIRMMLSVFHELDQMRKRERWTRQQLEAYQTSPCTGCANTPARSSFYQRFHKDSRTVRSKNCPSLPATVMKHFDELQTDRTVRLEDLRAHMANDHMESALTVTGHCHLQHRSSRHFPVQPR